MAVEGRGSGGVGWGEEGKAQRKSVPEPTREIDFLAFDLVYHVSINEPMPSPHEDQPNVINAFQIRFNGRSIALNLVPEFDYFRFKTDYSNFV